MTVEEATLVEDILEESLEGAIDEAGDLSISADEMLSVVINAHEDPKSYIETFLVIKTKDKRLVRLKLNATQRRILDKILELRAAGEPVRLIILKARQEGVSTFIQALYFMFAVTTPNIEVWTLAHDRESSGNLLLMSKLYLDRLPEAVTPMTSGRDKKRLVFENPDHEMRKRPETAGLLSRIYIDQAKNANAGRSTTITMLHISEEAFWGPEGPNTKLSLFQAVPTLPGTMIIRETTANGIGDQAEFHKEWTENYGMPGAKWVCLFFGFHEHEEYRLPVPDELKDADGRLILRLDPDGQMREEDLRAGAVARAFGTDEPYPLDDEQLYWRRVVLEEKCGNDVGRFMQEYPCTPDEAFKTSGRPWFTRAGLEAVAKSIREPIAKGVFVHERPEAWRDTTDQGLWRTDFFHPDWYRRGHMPSWVDDSQGEWWIWRLPEPGREYIMAIDTAEGKVDGDKSAIEIFARDTLEQVAEFNGHLDPDLVAHQAAMAGFFYNDAWSIPEVNNTGYGFMSTFVNLYRRIYFRKDPDAALGARQKYQYGFRTNPVTRPIITLRAQAYIRELPMNGYPKIRSRRLFNEMQSFQKDKLGYPRAMAKGTQDDLVICFCLVLEEAERRPVRVTPEKRQLTLADDKSFQEHQARMRGRRGASGRARYF